MDMDGRAQDETEVESLSGQLAAQISYTNELLVQLQELEHAQLHSQRDVQAKQQALRQAMAVCDSVRADQAELRKKHAIAQELAARATADAKRWKVEFEVKEKELEGLEKFAEEARDEIDHLRTVGEKSERKIRDLETERVRLSNQLDEYAEEEAQRMAKHRESFEALSKELAELKSVHHPMKNELHVYKARSEEVERNLKQREAHIKRLEEDLDRAKRRVNQLEENERHMHLLEAQFKSDLHNEQSKAFRTQQQVEAAQSLAESRQAELEQARKEASDLKQSNRAFQDEIRSLNAELETVGNDLLAQAQARALDKERLESRIRELQDELGRLALEARERERNAAEQTRARTAEFAQQRKASEQQYARLQEEYRQLHELLQRTQNEVESQTQQFQIEREELESRLAASQDRARNAETDLSRRDAEAKREAGVLLAEIQRLQNDTASRAGAQVEALGMLHSTIQQLAAECQELQDNYNTALEEVESLRADAANHKRIGAVGIQDWHSDTKRALGDLAEANNRTRVEYERVRDLQLSAEVQRDEERAKNLMLEEERRRLESEVQYLKQHVKGLEEASRERLENARLEFESAASEQDDLSRKVLLLSQQLEDLHAQNRTLQEERQRTASSMSENQNRQSQRIASLENQLETAETSLRKTVTERDSFEADRELMKRTIQDSANTIKSLQSQISALEAQQRDVADREKKHVRSHDTQVTSLRESVRKYQAQLAQTKSLLKVVSDQRKHLQEDNMALRAELDDVLRRSLSESAQLSSSSQGEEAFHGRTASVGSSPEGRLNGASNGSIGSSYGVPAPVPQKFGGNSASVSSDKGNVTGRKSLGVDMGLNGGRFESKKASTPFNDIGDLDEEIRGLRDEEDAEDFDVNGGDVDEDEVEVHSSNPLDLDLEKLRKEVEDLKSENSGLF